METKASQSAFPMPENEYHKHEWGLTKREYFAAKIMAGFISDSKMDNVQFGTLAKASVVCADSLIKALNEREKDEK